MSREPLRQGARVHKDDATRDFQVHIPALSMPCGTTFDPINPVRCDQRMVVLPLHHAHCVAQAKEREAMKRLEAGEWTPQQHWLISKT